MRERHPAPVGSDSSFGSVDGKAHCSWGRSVVPNNAVPADDLTVWHGGLLWVEGAWMQSERLTAVVQDQMVAQEDARARVHLNEDTDNARSWRDHLDAYEPYDPRRPIRVPTFALSMQVSVELAFFLVAVRNVQRAQERLPEHLRPEMTDQRLFHLTRNVAEHWDEVGGWSEAAFARDYPDRTLGQISVTNKEVYVSDVPVSRVIAWLARVKEALTQAIRDAGVDIPEDGASMVEGDDDRAWPPERRRERLWQVTQLDIEEWPREETPEKVAEYLQKRFQNRRERDGVD